MDGMYPAFESFTGIPFPLINPYENFVEFVDRNEDISHLENFGGIHMEFCYLSRLSKNDKYCETAVSILDIWYIWRLVYWIELYIFGIFNSNIIRPFENIYFLLTFNDKFLYKIS